jgi:tetratricopeptide (TPR) repeat protein
MKSRRFTLCDLGGEDTTNCKRGIIFFIFAGNLFFKATMVRRKHFIGMLLMGLLAVAACTQRAKVPEPVEGPTAELLAIDSLMWHQPDSALACLLPYFDTCGDANFCVSTASAYNRHYANLLLSELLYKNDYAQVNRAELLQAVAYFDSISQVSEPAVAEHGRSVEGPSNRIAFLDARAHYINGVGYYENDSLVPACAEYLKTLEVIENHFGEKDLVGHKARFMALTYGRLGEMFSEQFMMEPAIDSYENALVFCKIEPTSPQGVSNILYRLGKQYDKIGKKAKASDYYESAIRELPNNNGLLFRDLVSTKALCDYQLGNGVEQSLNTLRQVQAQVDSENEYLLRCLIIGGIFFKEMMYDSALLYLAPVFENKENVIIQIQAADYLRIIYDSLDNKEKSDECVRFLANHVKTESQNKALVSQLDNLFQSHISQKQEKKAAQEKHDAVLRTVKVLVPIAFLMAVIVIMIIRRRNKRKLAEQDAEAQQKLETESKRHEEAMEAAHRAHRVKQAAISGRLKRSNQEVRELKDQIKQLDDLAAKSVMASSFDEEPICRLIIERVNEGQFKSKIDYIIYKDSALNKQQLLELRLAVDRHFRQFTVRLKKVYPELTNSDLDYCCLYLLGLTDADIAALMQRAYNTVIERNGKLKKIFGEENTLSVTLRTLANDSLFR